MQVCMFLCTYIICTYVHDVTYMYIHIQIPTYYQSKSLSFQMLKQLFSLLQFKNLEKTNFALINRRRNIVVITKPYTFINTQLTNLFGNNTPLSSCKYFFVYVGMYYIQMYIRTIPHLMSYSAISPSSLSPFRNNKLWKALLVIQFVTASLQLSRQVYVI